MPPATGACFSVSIFMASMIRTGSPAATVSPNLHHDIDDGPRHRGRYMSGLRGARPLEALDGAARRGCAIKLDLLQGLDQHLFGHAVDSHVEGAVVLGAIPVR